MPRKEARTAIDDAVERLRAIVLAQEEGAFIGSEDALIVELGCSRSTVRQVARLLEREGLLRVRRGLNGGYFGSRPDIGTIEETVAAYLETIEMDVADITIMASALWVEAVRKAAARARSGEEHLLGALRKKIKTMKDHATFEQIRSLELETQTAIFDLANSAYIKLIFDINVAFSRIKFEAPAIDNESEMHSRFVRDWRNAKLLEIDAIASGDRELAGLAARHSRQVWHARLTSRHGRSYAQPEKERNSA